MRNKVLYKTGEDFEMLPLWKCCIFTLGLYCCEWLSQLSGAKACFFVGLSEIKLPISNFSPFSLFQIAFLFCIFFSFRQAFSVSFLLNSSFLPLFPQLFSSHSSLSHLCISLVSMIRGLACCWATMCSSTHLSTAEHRHSQLARGCWEGEHSQPALGTHPCYVIHLSPG